MIYVGGWDCPSCSAWKNEYKAAWLASPEYKQVTYVEVNSPRLVEAYQKRYWPGDLAPILEQIPHRSGTPRFLVVQDGRIIANRFGVGEWKMILATLDKLLV